MVETQTIDSGAAVASPTPAQRYQFANHLGSASLELDEAGGLISYEEYSPYGSTTYQAGRSAAEVSLKRYRYTGKERDEENGFTYHGARYYAPWLGRWTSCDPSGLVNGINEYQYANVNPVLMHDPSGKAGSFFDTFKPGGRVFEAVDSVVNPNKNEHPALAAVMNNLDKRGKDLVEGTVQDLKQTAEDYADIAYYSSHSNERGATEKIKAAAQRRLEAPITRIEGAAKGFGQAIKRVGEAGGDIAYYSIHSDDPKASAKIANAATDIFIDAPQIVLTVEGAAGLAKGVAGTIPKGVPTPPEPFFEGGVPNSELDAAFKNSESGTIARLPGQNPVTGEGLHQVTTRTDAAPNARISHAEELTFKGIKGAKGKPVEFRRHSADQAAPAGSYARSNPVTVVNTVKTDAAGAPKISPKGFTYKDRYLDPSGNFIKPKTAAQWESVHHK